MDTIHWIGGGGAFSLDGVKIGRTNRQRTDMAFLGVVSTNNNLRTFVEFLDQLIPADFYLRCRYLRPEPALQEMPSPHIPGTYMKEERERVQEELHSSWIWWHLENIDNQTSSHSSVKRHALSTKCAPA